MANTNFARKRGNGKCPTTPGKVARVRLQNFPKQNENEKEYIGEKVAGKARAEISQAQNQDADSSVLASSAA